MTQTTKGKAILLVRVSTLKQDFDAQEKELYNLALSDGYKDSEIIPICEKESGIKLSEEERNGLNRMKEIISEGGVTCVYAWEISRIARKKKIIFSIVDFLQVRGIQLIVKEPYIKLLNEDGTINEQGELSLTLFAQISESEMRNKQARWKRTKSKYALEGRFSGGGANKYGYFIDEKGYYQVNEEEAYVVRWLYDTYINTNIGQYGLQKELEERGINLRRGLIKRILNEKTYTGEPIQIYGYKNGEKIPYHIRKYPQIISMETFEKAAKKRAENNTHVDKSPSYFFGAKLIKCPLCGHSLVAVKAEKRYICWSYYHHDKDYEKCENNFQIDIIGLDSVLWYDTINQYTNYILNLRNGDIEKYTEQIEILKTKISVWDTNIAKSQPKKERVAEMYEEGVYSREQMKEKLNKINADNAEFENKKAEYESEVVRLESLINGSNDLSFADKILSVADKVNDMEELKKMYDMVHQFISSVEVRDTTIENNREVKEIKCFHLDGTFDTYYLEKRKRITKINFWMLRNDKIMEITDRVTIVKRAVGRKTKNFK